MTEDQVFDFARNMIRSVWALELLLLLHRERERSWSESALVRELRSSEAVIRPCLDRLMAEKLVSADAKGFHYASEGPHEAAVAELARIYAARPMALAKTIMRTPDDRLTIFSNAFKLKD